MGAHDVFVSYANRDKLVADAACAVLERRGVRCWIAPRDVMPGKNYGESILDGIEGARVMVLVFSENANKSKQVEREIERAVNKGLWLIPIRIEDVVPRRSLEYFISSSHWLDALTPPVERHLERLAEAVQNLLASQAEAETPQAPGRTSAPKDRDAGPSGFPPTRTLVTAHPMLWVLGIVVALVVIGTTLFVWSQDKGSSSSSAVIVGTCDEGGSCGVQQRTEPRTAAPRLVPNDLQDGATVTVVCQTTGDLRSSAGHGSSYVWYRLDNGAYVNSVYMNIQASGIPPC